MSATPPTVDLKPYRLTEAFYRRKITNVQARMADSKMQGLLLLDPYNVIYLTGFFHVPNERPLGLYIPARGKPALFVPLLEQEHAGETWISDIRTYFEYPSEEHAVVWMAREAGVRDLGIDSISYDLYGKVVASGVNLTVTPMITEMRFIKDPEEIRLVELAAGYADYCLENLRDHAASIIKGGGTELDILNACLGATAQKMQREVGDVFELRGGSIVGTVHTGPRAALPHGRPQKRAPHPGEPLIAGIGAKVYGYHAESGATFILGEPNADQRHCLEAASACNDAAINALRAGATCASVNEAALAELRKAGLESAIRHRIGHGMGVQGHEGPWLAPGDNTIITPNMVFSNEPGIYRPGVDGYRTINTMIATENGASVPSRFLAQHPPEKRIIPV